MIRDGEFWMLDRFGMLAGARLSSFNVNAQNPAIAEASPEQRQPFMTGQLSIYRFKTGPARARKHRRGIVPSQSSNS